MVSSQSASTGRGSLRANNDTGVQTSPGDHNRDRATQVSSGLGSSVASSTTAGRSATSRSTRSSTTEKGVARKPPSSSASTDISTRTGNSGSSVQRRVSEGLGYDGRLPRGNHSARAPSNTPESVTSSNKSISSGGTAPRGRSIQGAANSYYDSEISFGEHEDLKNANSGPVSLPGLEQTASQASSKVSSNVSKLSKYSNANVGTATLPGSTVSSASQPSKVSSKTSSRVSKQSSKHNNADVDAWVASTTAPDPVTGDTDGASSVSTVKPPSPKPPSKREGKNKLRTYSKVTKSSEKVTTLQLRDGKPHVSETKKSTTNESPGTKKRTKDPSNSKSRSRHHFKQVVTETETNISLDWNLRDRKVTKTESSESKKVTRRSYEPFGDGEKKDGSRS